jgi:plastocyanin
VDVQILEFQFVPAEFTVSAGTTVRWSNLGASAHTATSVSPAGTFDSGTLLTGQSFEFQFTTPGVYTYRCSFHPSMTGKITVVRRLYLPLILR